MCIACLCLLRLLGESFVYNLVFLSRSSSIFSVVHIERIYGSDGMTIGDLLGQEQ